jgi:hypothetical protein
MPNIRATTVLWTVTASSATAARVDGVHLRVVTAPDPMAGAIKIAAPAMTAPAARAVTIIAAQGPADPVEIFAATTAVPAVMNAANHPRHCRN